MTFYKWSMLAMNNFNISTKYGTRYLLFSMLQSKGKKRLSYVFFCGTLCCSYVAEIVS